MVDIAIATPELDDARRRAVGELRRRIERVLYPDVRPVSDARALADLTAASPVGRNGGLVAWDGETAVGVAETWQWYGKRNRGQVDVLMGVDPDRRRQGVATALMAATADHLRRDGRTAMVTFGRLGDDTVGFWRSLAIEVSYTEQASELELDDVDGDLMGSWIARRAERADDLVLERWRGVAPDRLLDGFRVVRAAMDDAPIHDLTWEKGFDDRDEIVGKDEWMMAGSRTPWVIAAVTPDGEVAGYTCVEVDELCPWRSWQGDTGVAAAHRGRGIGRWVKAEMWRWLRADAPAVTRLETENATDNAAMLAINQAMGFRPTFVQGGWEIDPAILARRAGRAATSGRGDSG